MIDLSNAREGNRFEARAGKVFTYMKRTKDYHAMHDGWGLYGFNDDGTFAAAFKDYDLIRTLDSPAPAPADPMGDAGLVERLREWASCAGHSQISSMKRDLGEAAGRLATLSADNEALRRDLDEARASEREACAQYLEGSWFEDGGRGRAFARSIRSGEHLKTTTARDWHSKHGGGADA